MAEGEKDHVKAACQNRRSLFIKDMINMFKSKGDEEKAPKTIMVVEVTMDKAKVDEAKHLEEKSVVEKIHHSLRKHENMRKEIHLKGVQVEGAAPKKKTTKPPKKVKSPKATKAETTKAFKVETTQAPTTKAVETTKKAEVRETTAPLPWIGSADEKAPWDDGKIPKLPIKEVPNDKDILTLLNIVRASYTFERSYDKLIGNDEGKKQKFLEECTVALKPVQCTDVFPSGGGDLVVKLKGDRIEFGKVSKPLYETGLILPSFGDLGVVGLLPSLRIDSVPEDEIEPTKKPPEFCVDFDEVIDENGQKTGKSCDFAKKFIKSHLKLDVCVPQLAKQCPVTCGTCESGPKALNPKAKGSPERIVRIVEEFEDFADCKAMAVAVKDVNAKALKVPIDNVHVRLGKGCEQVSQSMLAYLDMGIHRRRLIDTAQFVVEFVFPVAKAAEAEKLAKTSVEDIKKSLNTIVNADKDLSVKTVVVNVFTPTLDVCIDVKNVKDEYDKKTGKSCKDTPKDPKTGNCFPHVAIQCPQTCGVCIGPTEPPTTTKPKTTAAPKTTKAETTATTTSVATTAAPKTTAVTTTAEPKQALWPHG
eukprot:TRINITY_DN1205_c0_g2_i3.p1 TRINITY_DN1205_c0_g2~~TRINITY_DN1205_c0_g2_i3.p1  ORF type:complete len:658 (+),score=177.72 TRINITY_DN1205_c0_g2_i3:211-1974(+)